MACAHPEPGGGFGPAVGAVLRGVRRGVQGGVVVAVVRGHVPAGNCHTGLCYGARPYHRTGSIDIDIFKGWDEPVRNCLGRFTKVKATGGTPMSDGIQFALQALSARKERHRILLVITDGDPDYGHAPVIRRQQRLAREAGIALVGVGIDYGCQSVASLYERHVLVGDVSKLPEQLLKTINDLVFPRGPARKVTLDGSMNTRTARP